MVWRVTEASSDLALFIGRFHPVLVHLPIGFLVLLATLEGLSLGSRFRAANASARFILLLLVPAAGASAFCGWLLSRSGGYEASLLEWHERLGIGLAVAVTVLLLLHALGATRAYRVGLALSCVLLMLASHLGGSLTHGRDYLTHYAPEPLRSWLAKAGMAGRPTPTSPAGGQAQDAVFPLAVQPIFRQYCVPCHGPEKAKAGLRLDSIEHLQRGNKDGPVIRAGDSAGSRLVRLVMLPLDDDAHMPPAGKPQPGPDDLALIRWWIDAGASPKAGILELKPPAEIQRILQARLGRSP
jgi:uncharacterized membrane protein